VMQSACPCVMDEVKEMLEVEDLLAFLVHLFACLKSACYLV